jgi:Protein of unknown function (DUF3626)
MLTPAQSAALRHMRSRAEAACADAKIASQLHRLALARSDYDALLRRLREQARVTLNFHPDRPLADGRTVIEKLLVDGTYESQFVTRISNGSRTAFEGGDRDAWEKTLFGGAYHQGGASAHERPKYGGLNVMRYADGACPRFGSCHFVLRPAVALRCSYSWGDSYMHPPHVGTHDAIEPVAAALLESLDAPIAPLALIPAKGSVGRALDSYIEAQIHGRIELSCDVEALVADPAFDDTATGEALRALCERHGLALERHPGFVLATPAVPSDFRGPRMPDLAARVDDRFARMHGELDAVAIGRAAQSLHRDPEGWSDWGTVDETLQHLKQLWHVLVRYGGLG